MNVLKEADGLVNGDRQEQYGHPHTDYTCTADMWASMIQRRYGVDIPITPDFACLMMVAVKISRECGKPKRDNLVDAAGYIACVEKCLERDAELNIGTPVGRISTKDNPFGFTAEELAKQLRQEIEAAAAPQAAVAPHFSDIREPGQVVKIEPLIQPINALPPVDELDE